MNKAIKRFAKKVNIEGKDGCWEWTAALNQLGYGVFFYKGKTVKAHRFSWLLYKGEIPKGDKHHDACILHKCDNRKCVNPAHLFIGTQLDNIKDMDGKGRRGLLPFNPTPYIFKHKLKGWKIKCTKFYFRNLFKLDKGNVNGLVAGRVNSVKGWEMIT